MTGQPAGWILIGAGIALLVAGALVLTGALGWFGRLPGDVRIERESTRIYFPIVSMLLLSVGLSVLLWVVRRLLR